MQNVLIVLTRFARKYHHFGRIGNNLAFYNGVLKMGYQLFKTGGAYTADIPRIFAKIWKKQDL